MPPALLVTAPDPELPGMLRPHFPGALFATAEQVRAIIGIKPGAMVVLLDAGDTSLVMGLMRKDVRAVAVMTRQPVPMMFRKPVVSALERPLVSTQVLTAVLKAMAELSPAGGHG
jgi:hypothetical protein